MIFPIELVKNYAPEESINAYHEIFLAPSRDKEVTRKAVIRAKKAWHVLPETGEHQIEKAAAYAIYRACLAAGFPPAYPDLSMEFAAQACEEACYTWALAKALKAEGPFGDCFDRSLAAARVHAADQ